MPGEFLDQVLADHGRMPAGAAGRQQDAIDAAQLLRVEIQAAKVRRRLVERQPPAHGVTQCLGLLENLLEHEMVVAAQVDIAGLQLERLHVVVDFALVAMNDAQRVSRDDGDLVLGQIDDLVRVPNQWRGVAGDKVLVLPHAHHQRAAMSGCDDHIGMVAEDDRQTVSPLQFSQRTALTAATSG